MKIVFVGTGYIHEIHAQAAQNLGIESNRKVIEIK